MSVRMPGRHLNVAERTGEVAGIKTHWRESPASGRAPVLYVHGVPTGSWDWLPYLERIGGVAPDLPGFASSAKPADFDYSIGGYDRWLGAFAEAVGFDRFSLVVHDWGGMALAFAQRFPDRIERLVIHTCVPLLPGYRWHWAARIWRTPVIGELFMAGADEIEDVPLPGREPVQILGLGLAELPAQLRHLVDAVQMRSQQLEDGTVALREIAVGAVEDEGACLRPGARDAHLEFGPMPRGLNQSRRRAS